MAHACTTGPATLLLQYKSIQRNVSDMVET